MIRRPRQRLPTAVVSSGMTLIELMVVIVVLGIVASLIIPQFGGSLASMQLRGSARGVGDLMDYCYHAAVSSGRVHALVFNADGHRFDILADRPREAAGSAGAEAPGLEPISIPGYVERALPAGVRVGQVWTFDQELSATQDGDVQLLFFPDGTAEFAAITLANAEGDQCTVTLDGLSGMIEVGEVESAAAAEGTT